MGACDIKGTAVSKCQARRTGEHGATTGSDEIARHARVVEYRQRARTRLNDFTRTSQNANRPDRALIDVNTKAVVIIGTRGDRGLKLIIIIPCFEVMQEIEAQGGRP